LGGMGGEDFSIASQVVIQAKAVGITVIWCAIGSAVLFKLVDLVLGLRVDVEAERLGLDVSSHGESAYHS
jgi:Amt family ammonium transporter